MHHDSTCKSDVKNKTQRERLRPPIADCCVCLTLRSSAKHKTIVSKETWCHECMKFITPCWNSARPLFRVSTSTSTALYASCLPARSRPHPVGLLNDSSVGDLSLHVYLKLPESCTWAVRIARAARYWWIRLSSSWWSLHACKILGLRSHEENQ